MFSDTYRIKLVDEVIYEVTGKLITRGQGDLKIEGFNPSAEEADEGTDEAVESGVDVVLNHRLVETYAFGDKKSYTLYLKDYMKKWVWYSVLVLLMWYACAKLRFVWFLCVYGHSKGNVSVKLSLNS